MDHDSGSIQRQQTMGLQTMCQESFRDGLADHEGDDRISAHAGRRIGVASRAGGLLVAVLFSPKKELTPIILTPIILFAGGDEVDQVRDNLDLERWFRLLKGHERRIHGHKHAGVRIVQEGPATALALDAHRAHRGLFTADDLLPNRSARVPECQRQAMKRRKIMRKARSKTKRPKLPAELERRYRACSSRV